MVLVSTAVLRIGLCESLGKNPIDVIDAWISYNSMRIDKYAIGLDSEYLDNETGPHYHIHIVYKSHYVDKEGTKEFTQKCVKKYRQGFTDKGYNFGSVKAFTVRFVEWDNDDRILAYAIKEKLIRVNFDMTEEFRNKVSEVLATKKLKYKEAEFQKEKKERNTKQKNDVIEYITENYGNAFSQLPMYYQYPVTGSYGGRSVSETIPDEVRHIRQEARAIRLCIEMYQNVKDKTFRRFDIENYVLTYFRVGLKKTPLEMLDVRETLGI